MISFRTFLTELNLCIQTEVFKWQLITLLSSQWWCCIRSALYRFWESGIIWNRKHPAVFVVTLPKSCFRLNIVNWVIFNCQEDQCFELYCQLMPWKFLEHVFQHETKVLLFRIRVVPKFRSIKIRWKTFSLFCFFNDKFRIILKPPTDSF